MAESEEKFKAPEIGRATRRVESYGKVFNGIAGLVCLVIGIAFLFVPVLPTLPFLAASAYFFSRSSEWARQRLDNVLRRLRRGGTRKQGPTGSSSR